jgi:hypothetical protein
LKRWNRRFPCLLVRGLYTDKLDTVYFIDCEDNTWHWLNAETGETGALTKGRYQRKCAGEIINMEEKL